MKKSLFTSLALIICLLLKAQSVQPREIYYSASGITELNANVSWGKIKIEPLITANTFKVITIYDNYDKKNLDAGAGKLQTRTKGNTIYVSTPAPEEGQFESYDITIQVPPATNLVLKMERGGDIHVTDITGHIEIDNQNGSTSVKGAANWVTINNFNGGINVSFKELKKVEAISLITFNGGITLNMPDVNGADVTLRTKKNGWIRSDFPVKATNGEIYKNMQSGNYTMDPGQWNGTIGKGGTKIIAITNNGPIELKALHSLVSSL